MSTGLMRIELRRSIVWGMLPLILALAGFLLWNDPKMTLMLWPESVLMVRDLALFAGPILGGLAAFVAGRDRRRGIEELVATAPRPELSRRLATCMATLSWGLFTYVLVGAAVLVITGLRATWGGPELLPVLVGLLVVFAQGALGYAAGHYLPSRFTAPVASIGLFGAQLFPVVVTQNSPLLFLSPLAGILNASVWTGIQPEAIALPQALFMLGVGILGLGAFALGVRRSVLCLGVAVLGIALSIAGAATISSAAPNSGVTLNPSFHNVVAYEPVCKKADITVCVHPAYEANLGEVSGVANRVSEPLSGVPGIPDRARQIPGLIGDNPEPQDGTVDFTLSGYSFDTYNVAYQIAKGLVRLPEDVQAYQMNSVEPSESGLSGSRKAQDAIEVWLLETAGKKVECVRDVRSISSLSTFSTESCQAADKFAALGPEKRRDWLEKNYSELRNGELTLEKLP